MIVLKTATGKRYKVAGAPSIEFSKGFVGYRQMQTLIKKDYFNTLRKSVEHNRNVNICEDKQEIKQKVMEHLEQIVDKQLRRMTRPGYALCINLQADIMNEDGIFLTEIPRVSQELTEWRKQVFERDQYKCVECGQKGTLQAHHIKEWADYPDLRYEIDNGITLCRECHSKKHPKLTKLILSSHHHEQKIKKKYEDRQKTSTETPICRQKTSTEPNIETPTQQGLWTSFQAVLPLLFCIPFLGGAF